MVDVGYLQLGVAALSGGGVSFVLGKLIERGHAREQSEIMRLREDFDKCEKRHEECRADYLALSERVRAVEASTPSYLARWVKDQDKKIVDDNQAGVNSMAYVPGPYSQAEQGLVSFTTWYLRQLS